MSRMELFEQLVALLERSSLAELEYRSADGWRMRLSRFASAPAMAGVPIASAPAPAGDEVCATPAATDSASPVATDEPSATLALVRAGVAGLFCASPAPGEPPFVRVGDVVEEGQTLAIVEAMKMLNSVEADRRGRIVRILVEDQSAVEAPTVLFELKPLEVIDV